MLQVIFAVLLFSIGLLLVEPKHQAPVKSPFDALHEIVLKIVDMIMAVAPVGVFALLAALVAEISNPIWLIGLLWYGVSVVIGLCIHDVCLLPRTRDLANRPQLSQFL